MITGAAFLPALRNGFTWDDWGLIFQTIGYRGFDWRHLHWMVTTTHMSNYTPLAWLSYAGDYALFGLNPVGYHLTNVLLHALNAVLFFRLSAELLKRSFPREDESTTIACGAAFAALVFALHPLRVESVAWAAERRDVLAGAFSLGALLFYVRAADARDAFRLRALSVACFAGAALSKATAVPLPAALVALDLYPLKRLGASVRELRARFIEKIPYAVISAATALMAVRAQLASSNFTPVAAHGLSSRLAQSLYGAAFYVAKTLLPTSLYALYPLERLSWHGPEVLGAAAVLVLAAVCGAALGVEKKAQAALWLFYLAMLSPVLGLLQNGPQLVALRYSYLACLGWAALAGAAAVAALRLRRRNPLSGTAVLGLLGLWLVGNAWAAQRQIPLWRDDRTLWEGVLNRYPLSPEANENFAEGLLQENDPVGAEKYARASLMISPDERNALRTLSKALLAQGRTIETREMLEGATTAVPDWGEGHALLGFLLSQEGRGNEALPHLLRAAELLPASAETQANTGASLAVRGRFAEALPYYERAAKLDPAYAPALEHVRRDLQNSGVNAR